MGLQFFAVLLASTIALASGSLLWYKVTKSPRPEVLTKVRDVLLTTPVGKQAAGMLGVEDESKVEPINVSSVAGSIVSSVATSVEKQVQNVVVGQVVTQIAKQYDGFNSEQKKQLEELICKPKSQ